MSNDLSSARNAVFQKLGRNIVLFQQLEHGWKDFFAERVVEGSSVEEFAQSKSARRGKVVSKSLGQVIGHVFEDLAKGDPEPPPLAAGAIGWFRTSFRIEGDEYLAQKQESLKRLVGERNRLVHHMLEDYDLRTAEGIARLDAVLDPQAERVRAELHELREAFLHFEEIRQVLAEHINTPDFLDNLHSR